MPDVDHGKVWNVSENDRKWQKNDTRRLFILVKRNCKKALKKLKSLYSGNPKMT
jgi:hypothetical protein